MPSVLAHVLVLCTGNICRSPMGEVLLRQYATSRGRRVEVRSASVLGIADKPAHKNSIKVMEEFDISLRDHRSTPLTQELMNWADYVLVMEYAHMARLRKKYPDCEAKVALLGGYGGYTEIRDPVRSYFAGPFRQCRKEILRCVEGFVDNVLPIPEATSPAE